MMVAFPYEMAQSILDGLGMTAERVESNPVKQQIKERLQEENLEEIKPMEEGTAYYYPES